MQTTLSCEASFEFQELKLWKRSFRARPPSNCTSSTLVHSIQLYSTLLCSTLLNSLLPNSRQLCSTLFNSSLLNSSLLYSTLLDSTLFLRHIPTGLNDLLRRVPTEINELWRHVPTGLKDLLRRVPSGLNDLLRHVPTGLHDLLRRVPTRLNNLLRRVPSGPHDLLRRAPTRLNDLLRRVPSGPHDLLRHVPTGLNELWRHVPTGPYDLLRRVPSGLNDLFRHVPTGLNDLWASENQTIRNPEFLYETSFDQNLQDLPCQNPKFVENWFWWDASWISSVFGQSQSCTRPRSIRIYPYVLAITKRKAPLTDLKAEHQGTQWIPLGAAYGSIKVAHKWPVWFSFSSWSWPFVADLPRSKTCCWLPKCCRNQGDQCSYRTWETFAWPLSARMTRTNHDEEVLRIVVFTLHTCNNHVWIWGLGSCSHGSGAYGLPTVLAGVHLGRCFPSLP